MKKKIIPPNNITALREKRGMSIYVLAEKVGISAGQMSRIENSKSGLKPKLLLKTAAALDFPTNKIVSLPLSKKFQSTGDDVLMGEAIGWLLEASEKLKVEVSRHQLSKLVPYIYKEYVDRPMNFEGRKYLAFTAIQVLKITSEK